MGTLGNKGSNFKGKTFGRRKCYNCDSPKHFVADCPYERREEKSEKLILKKKRFNKFAKRRGDKALVHEEYLSEDEEDGDDDEHKGSRYCHAFQVLLRLIKPLRLPQREQDHRPPMPHGKRGNIKVYQP